MKTKRVKDSKMTKKSEIKQAKKRLEDILKTLKPFIKDYELQRSSSSGKWHETSNFTLSKSKPFH